MRKSLSLAGMLVVVMAAAFAFAHHGPDNVVLDDAAAKRGPVKFPHAAHVKVVDACETCHHTDKGLTAETDTKVQKCSACHLDPKDNAPSMREMSLTKNPFHVNCIGCHKERAAGPTKCNDCHAAT